MGFSTILNMTCSKPGQFYGKTNETLFLNGIIVGVMVEIKFSYSRTIHAL